MFLKYKEKIKLHCNEIASKMELTYKKPEIMKLLSEPLKKESSSSYQPIKQPTSQSRSAPYVKPFKIKEEEGSEDINFQKMVHYNENLYTSYFNNTYRGTVI